MPKGSKSRKSANRRRPDGAAPTLSERFHTLVELSTDFYWEQDERFRFTVAIGPIQAKSGIDPQALIGTMRWDHGATPVSDGGSWETHQAALAAHQPFTDFIYRRPNDRGEARYIDTSGRPMFDAKKRLIGYCGIARDVTDRIRAEQALRQSGVFLESMFETMDEGVSVFDADLRMVAVNRRFREILGFPESLCQPGTPFEAFVRHNVEQGDYGPGDPEQQIRDRVARARRFEPHQFERERSDGTILEVRGRPLPGGGFVTVYADITQRARAERELRQSNAILEDTLAHMDQGISIFDRDLRLLAFNGRLYELLDFPDQLRRVNTPLADFIRYNAERGEYGPGDIEEQVRARIEIARQFKPHHFERARPDGSVLEIRGMPIPGGRGFVTTYTDITKRAKAEQALRDSEARFRSLTVLSSDWFWEQDAELRFVRLEGRHPSGDDTAFAADVGKAWWDAGYEVDVGWDVQRQQLEAHLPFRDLVLRRQFDDGVVRYVLVSGEPIVDGAARFGGYRGVGRDVTEEKRADERIQYLATHDALTSLPNRVLFNQLLNHAIESARRYKRTLAVLFVDLDRFKIINDTLGHEAGDTLLKEIAARLIQCLRSSDVVARLGGDEFVVLLPETNETHQVAVVARKILAAVIDPVTIAGQECRVTASIGICTHPTDDADMDDGPTLMKCADIAMYLAKAEGKNNFQFYSKNVKALSLERLTLESDLRHALEHGEFRLHYQAKLDLKTDRITGVEALLRWQHPTLGMMAPAQFIPLAEETGLIVPIGRWVLQTACAQCAAWLRDGLSPVPVAVNLSSRQFADANLLTDIKDVLRASGLDPRLLELEITESMMMQKPERAAQLLGAIKELGVRLAIDDFGTGYSSLAQIKRFPIDTLKIDRSFIREIMVDASDRAIAEAIIAMGKTLSLKIVAEGVETGEQQSYLRSRACDEIQGFYFSKPIPPEDFAAMLRRHVPIARDE